MINEQIAEFGQISIGKIAIELVYGDHVLTDRSHNGSFESSNGKWKCIEKKKRIHLVDDNDGDSQIKFIVFHSLKIDSIALTLLCFHRLNYFVVDVVMWQNHHTEKNDSSQKN